jgi:phosphoribosylglycinamide formyltransferase 1
VVSRSEQDKGLEFARERTVPTCIVERQRCDSDDAFSRPIFDACRAHGAELVVMGGFLKFVPIPPDFNHRVMNIHPALIPAFSGPGFYGRRVHQAVLDYGAKVSGCTVHFVDNQFDHGPIILQRTVEVRDSDKPETLQQRVFEQECVAYPEAIRLFAEGRLRVEGRRVIIDPKVT